MSKTYTLEVIDIEGELGLELNEEICQQLGWKTNDTVEWSINEDGTISLSKVDENDLKNK